MKTSENLDTSRTLDKNFHYAMTNEYRIRTNEFFKYYFSRVNTLMEFRPFLPTHPVDVDWGLVVKLALPGKVTILGRTNRYSDKKKGNLA
jgi:hypothetical protein